MDEPSALVAGTPPDATSIQWRIPLLLFALTVLSTFLIGAMVYVDAPFPAHALQLAWSHHAFAHAAAISVRWLAGGWLYAVPLLTILLCHEFGHYLMARRHRVPASLPMFLPVPIPPFGTFGAVIRMRGRIETRNALLDIGAAGPLAGLLLAVPVTYAGLVLSPVKLVTHHGVSTEPGTSILLALLTYAAKGPMPYGYDVALNPLAMAGWVGLFVTMINLVPYGQLDGGHVAYALMQSAHDRYSRHLLALLLALGVGTGLYWGRVLAHEHRDPWALGTGYTQGLNWFVFVLLIWLLHRRTGGQHPPTDPSALSPIRRLVAVVTLASFVLLFMPVPLRVDVFPP